MQMSQRHIILFAMLLFLTANVYAVASIDDELDTEEFALLKPAWPSVPDTKSLVDDDIDLDVGSGEESIVPVKEQTTPKFNQKEITPLPNTQSGKDPSRSKEELSTLQSMQNLLANQQKLLVNIQSQISTISLKLEDQQISIDRQDQSLEDHSWSIAELDQKQTQTTSDLYVLKSAITSHSADGHEEATTRHVPPTTPTTEPTNVEQDKTTTKYVVKIPPATNNALLELNDVENRVTDLEHMQTNLASVLKHLISEKVWLNTTSKIRKFKGSNDGLKFDETQSDNDTAVHLTEADVQEVEERTNQVLSSIDKWNKIEQTLHTSLSNLHSAHSKYDRELSHLANYTLNNGVMLSQLGQARLHDGGSILSLINTTSWLSHNLNRLKSTVMRHENISEEVAQQTEDNLAQLLELIQLNAMKITAMQDTVQGQGYLFESQLNRTVVELNGLERALVGLRVFVNTSSGNILVKVQLNKEKSDMLWSRMRILDNRLAHVEVKYLTEEVNKYQQSNEDLRQSLKLLEMQNQLETIEANINTQQSNHANLNSRLLLVEGGVGKLISSQSDMKTEWDAFGNRLPTLELMYDEVQLMINVLPSDCDDVYSGGIHSSGVKLVKPGKTHSAVEMLCDIDHVEERGWSVIQQRSSGEMSFNRNWEEYKQGFGEMRKEGEFWLGNELIHTLTSKYNYSLRFDMWTVNGSYIYAVYENFEILAESEGYRLLVSDYSGNATDSLKHSNNMNFSTADMDNDKSSMHCALFYTAGWWYKHCQYCNLNGRYTVGMVWFNHIIDDWMELSKTTIKISRNSL